VRSTQAACFDSGGIPDGKHSPTQNGSNVPAGVSPYPAAYFLGTMSQFPGTASSSPPACSVLLPFARSLLFGLTDPCSVAKTIAGSLYDCWPMHTNILGLCVRDIQVVPSPGLFPAWCSSCSLLVGLCFSWLVLHFTLPLPCSLNCLLCPRDALPLVTLLCTPVWPVGSLSHRVMLCRILCPLASGTTSSVMLLAALLHLGCLCCLCWPFCSFSCSSHVLSTSTA
jgi:hypothetical protein